MEKQELAKIATENAKKVLKEGDFVRVRPARCHSKKVTIVFSYWDGVWLVSKTGRNEYHSINIDRVNGENVDFTKTEIF